MGLVPPPNPIRVFVKGYHVLIFAAIICSFLVWEASSNSPVRAKDVIRIAALVAALVMYWILDLMRRHLSITKYLARIVQENLRITKDLAAIQPTELQRRDQKGSGDLASDTAAQTQAQVNGFGGIVGVAGVVWLFEFLWTCGGHPTWFQGFVG